VVDAPKEHKQPSVREIINGKITSQTLECFKWLEYNSVLQDSKRGLDYWREALGPDYLKAIDFFGLGFCENYKGLGTSVTIPVGYREKVFMIKHRLLDKEQGKYLTEPSGLNALVFNLDNLLKYDKIIIVEGEKKAIRLWLEGYPAGSPTNGANGFRAYPEWRLFFVGKEVLVIFDPDPEGRKEGEYITSLLHGTNILLPEKVDDYINSGFDIKEVLGEPWREN
jgi:hypothetical protein